MKKITKTDIIKTENMIIEGSALKGVRSIDMPNIEANLVSGVIDATLLKRSQTLSTINSTEQIPYTSVKFIASILGNTDIYEQTIKCLPLVKTVNKESVTYTIPFEDPIDLNDKVIIGIIDKDNKEFYTKEYAKIDQNGITLRNNDPTFSAPNSFILIYYKVNQDKSKFNKFEKTITITIENDNSYHIDSEFVLFYDSLSGKYFDKYGHYENISGFAVTVSSTPQYTWKSFSKRPFDSTNGATLSSSTGNYTSIKYPTTTYGVDPLTVIPPTNSAELYNENMGRIMNPDTGNVDFFTSTAKVIRYQEINGVTSFSYDISTSIKHAYVYQNYKFDVIPHINMAYTSTKVSSVALIGMNISLSSDDVSLDELNYINIDIIDSPLGTTYKKGSIVNNFSGSSAYNIKSELAQFYKAGVSIANTTGNSDYSVFDSGYSKLKTALTDHFTTNKDIYVLASAKLSIENEQVYSGLTTDVNVSFTLLDKEISRKYTIPCYLPRILSTIIG